MEIETKWKDDGALILVTDTDANINKLERIWNAKKEVIFDMFKGCDIKLLYRSGRLEKILTTVFEKPIDDLAGVPWRGKSCYAQLLFTKYIRFESYMEKTLQDLIKVEK